jgi:hypothetical protein
MSLEEDRDSVLSDFEDARSEPDRSRVVRETSPVTAELSAEQSQLPAGEPGVSGGPPGSSPAAPQLSADAKLHDTAWVAAGGGADHESAGSGDGEAESEEDDLYFDEDGAATDEEAEAGLHAHSAGPHRSGPTRSSTAHSSHSSHDAEGGAESAYDDAYGDAAAGAGHDDDADEEEGSAGGSDQGYPDLVLSDGRVLRRRVRPRTEADELEDGKKDAAMAGAMKEEGNRHFAAGTFDTAAACYTEALRYVPRDAEYCEHRAVYFGNRAACYLQLVRDDRGRGCSLDCGPQQHGALLLSCSEFYVCRARGASRELRCNLQTKSTCR